MNAIRPAAVAGLFYPAERDALERQLAGFLAEARAALPAEPGAPPKAIIAPHAGYVYSGAVAASAYIRLAPARGRIERVVLLGPSHRVPFRGLAVGAADGWATPLGTVPLDRTAIAALLGLPMVGTLPEAHAREHSLEVHLPFLQAVLGDFRLVPIVVGEATAESVAAVLDAAWGGPETLIVISTDLSHYHDYAACRTLDQRTAAAIERLDPSALGPEGACGCVPVGGMLRAARRRGMAIATLDIRNSGDTAGPKDRVVGYGSWALFEAPAASPAVPPLGELAAPLVALARGAILQGLGGAPPSPTELPAAFSAHGAVFVTLKRAGELRGCIGSAIAHRPLLEDLLDNARKAAFQDPRFPPLRAEEVAELELSVSLLTAPQPMRFADESELLAQLRPTIDGLIIQDGRHMALFLPSVWEQLPERRAFLAHLKRKAGLAVEHWSSSFRASRFETHEVKDQLGQGPARPPVPRPQAASGSTASPERGR